MFAYLCVCACMCTHTHIHTWIENMSFVLDKYSKYIHSEECHWKSHSPQSMNKTDFFYNGKLNSNDQIYGLCTHKYINEEKNSSLLIILSIG